MKENEARIKGNNDKFLLYIPMNCCLLQVQQQVTFGAPRMVRTKLSLDVIVELLAALPQAEDGNPYSTLILIS